MGVKRLTSPPSGSRSPPGSTPSWRPPRTQIRAALRRPPRRGCCSPSPRPLSGAGRPPSPTATKTTGPPNGFSSRTALSPSGDGGMPPDSTRAAARYVPSGSTGSRARPPSRGNFRCPGGFDPAAQVTEAVSGASYRHAVSVRVHGSEKAVRMRMPGSIAAIEPVTGEPGWVRARWRVQRLDWVPPVLARLGRPFVTEEPRELRQRGRALAEQLATYAHPPGPAAPLHPHPPHPF